MGIGAINSQLQDCLHHARVAGVRCLQGRLCSGASGQLAPGGFGATSEEPLHAEQKWRSTTKSCARARVRRFFGLVRSSRQEGRFVVLRHFGSDAQWRHRGSGDIGALLGACAPPARRSHPVAAPLGPRSPAALSPVASRSPLARSADGAAPPVSLWGATRALLGRRPGAGAGFWLTGIQAPAVSTTACSQRPRAHGVAWRTPEERLGKVKGQPLPPPRATLRPAPPAPRSLSDTAGAFGALGGSSSSSLPDDYRPGPRRAASSAALDALVAAEEARWHLHTVDRRLSPATMQLTDV